MDGGGQRGSKGETNYGAVSRTMCVLACRNFFLLLTPLHPPDTLTHAVSRARTDTTGPRLSCLVNNNT